MENKGFETFDTQLSLDDYRKFNALGADSNFVHWRKSAEQFQLQRAQGLLEGMNLPENIKNPTDYLRGGYDMYIKLFRVIDRAEDMINQLEPKEDDAEEEN